MRTVFRLWVITIALMIVALPAIQSVSAKNAAGLATLQGMITGFDQDGDRVPLSWVRVNATSQSFNLTVFTGLNGLYVLILPPGTYTVSTTIPGYQSQYANVTLTPGQLLLRDFILRSAYAVSPSIS